MRFGVSTHLVHPDRLKRAHFESIAAHGFDLVEVFATRTHFDYHDGATVSEVRRWLDALHLEAGSLHAPICDGFAHGAWGRAYSNASPDAGHRMEAVHEAEIAIRAARDLGCGAVVLHLGLPQGQPIPPGDNDPAAMRRSLEPMVEAAATARVQLALEVIPNDLATPEALLSLLDGDLELGDAAICLDFGHAHIVGGAPEAVEALGGYIVTTHVHDNRGRNDDHLLPFSGSIDWPLTLTALYKVGYTGPLVFEVPDHGDAARTLDQMVGVRRRLQAILDGLAEPLPFSEEG